MKMPARPRRNARLRRQVPGKIGGRRTEDEFALDKQIAAQLRAGRALRDFSQEMLAAKVGVTFQQVQKYETAINRVSASRLIMIARVLDLPPTWFFEGISGPAAQVDAGLAAVLALSGRISRLRKRERRIVARLVDELER
jgi:transcriptional regulator with XRE-family HTH domain